MWFNTKSATRKLSRYNLPTDAIMWIGVVSFFASILISVEIFAHALYVVGLWLDVLITILSFYVSFQLLTLIGSSIVETFVEMYKPKNR